MRKTPNQLISTALNPLKAVALYKNYKQHVNPKWNDVTCLEPIEVQWKAYQSDRADNTEKRKKQIILKKGKAKWNKNLK